MREGLSTVIVGKPNVGKSSMLNNLIQDNKAIVTEVAGTTERCLRRVRQCSWRAIKIS